MKEFNKHNLIEAIASLPEYEPKLELWEAIENDLELDKQQNKLETALQKLPTYEPPTEIWDQIVSNLESESPAIKQAAKIRFIGWQKWAAAATVAFLLMAGWWMTSIESNVIAFAEETVDDLLLQQDWNEDEGAIEELMALCKVKLATCQEPDFQQLQEDLDELNEAKESLQAAIGAYGTNPNLIAQIKEIELNRNDVVKKMLEKLI